MRGAESAPSPGKIGLNYSKNVAIVSTSFIFSTFGIQTLSHFIKSLCVIKNSENKT